MAWPRDSQWRAQDPIVDKQKQDRIQQPLQTRVTTISRYFCTTREWVNSRTGPGTPQAPNKDLLHESIQPWRYACYHGKHLMLANFMGSQGFKNVMAHTFTLIEWQSQVEKQKPQEHVTKGKFSSDAKLPKDWKSYQNLTKDWRSSKTIFLYSSFW